MFALQWKSVYIVELRHKIYIKQNKWLSGIELRASFP
jgi:hypothetical protein